jgi:hypothetical protein
VLVRGASYHAFDVLHFMTRPHYHPVMKNRGRVAPLAPRPAALAVRHPAPGSPKPGAVPLPPPLRVKTDVLALLAAERGEQ